MALAAALVADVAAAVAEAADEVTAPRIDEAEAAALEAEVAAAVAEAAADVADVDAAFWLASALLA